MILILIFDILDGDDSHTQQVWRSDSTKRQSLQCKQYQYTDPTYNNNFSSLKGSNTSLVTPALIDTKQRKPSDKNLDHYSTQQGITYRNNLQRSKTPTALPISPSPAKSNMNYHDSLNEQIIYDEFLNTIVMTDSQAELEKQKQQYFQHQQQMVWIPRDDMIQSETSIIQSTKTYNSHQHKPQYAPQLPQQSLMLPNSRDLPPDLKNVNPAFTIR